MSIRGAESVFGVPETHWEVHAEGDSAHSSNRPNGSPETGDTSPETGVKWVNSELHEIASTIETLQSRLEEANARLSAASAVETTEVEIGRLFLEAQKFTEASLAKLEGRVNEILHEAQSKAEEILTEATEEAQEIRRQAQFAALASTKTVRELQAAIAGFTTVNTELLRELGSLNTILASGHQEPIKKGIESAPTSAPD